jgi:hypothetical protein
MVRLVVIPKDLKEEKMKYQTITIENEVTGEKIILQGTNDIQKLQNQLMLLGTKGLHRSPWAEEIRKKINKLLGGPGSEEEDE